MLNQPPLPGLWVTGRSGLSPLPRSPTPGSGPPRYHHIQWEIHDLHISWYILIQGGLEMFRSQTSDNMDRWSSRGGSFGPRFPGLLSHLLFFSASGDAGSFRKIQSGLPVWLPPLGFEATQRSPFSRQNCFSVDSFVSSHAYSRARSHPMIVWYWYS